MSSPYPPFGSQDLKDDDGQVIDSFLIETDAPPDLKEAVEPIPVLTKPVPVYATRIKAGYQIITASMTEAFMLFAPDTYRVACSIRVTSLNGTPDFNQYVLLASDKNSLNGTAMSGSAYRARQGQDVDALDSHTGAIWVVGNASIATEGLEVSWILTTVVK